MVSSPIFITKQRSYLCSIYWFWIYTFQLVFQVLYKSILIDLSHLLGSERDLYILLQANVPALSCRLWSVPYNHAIGTLTGGCAPYNCAFGTLIALLIHCKKI